MTVVTVEDAVAAHFLDSPYLTDNNGDTKLFGHDFLHALLKASANSDRGEEIVAIYQAILLGDPEVTRRTTWGDGTIPPTFDQVRSTTISGVRAYVDSVVGNIKAKGGLAPEALASLDKRRPLSDQEIEMHYAKALALRWVFKEKIGRNLGDIPISELRQMPFERFTALLPEMERLYTLASGRSGGFSRQ